MRAWKELKMTTSRVSTIRTEGLDGIVEKLTGGGAV